jgi:L-ascorbate metabolism protein UlaG (beta-lactamase superfamily)
MRIQWYGQSAFALSGDEAAVFIDPFGDMSALASGHGITFEYPAIEGVEADLLLVTHEHIDHNGVEVVGGEPTTLRATAGRHESPIGEVVGIASEHDGVAGTERGPNTIFAFSLDGLRVAHFGDFGQRAMRPEQVAALGEVDLMFLPVGGGPTTDATQAHEIVSLIKPRWVVPMHYRTPRVSFLEPADAFLEPFGEQVQRLSEPSFETGDLRDAANPVAVVPAAP